MREMLGRLRRVSLLPAALALTLGPGCSNGESSGVDASGGTSSVVHSGGSGATSPEGSVDSGGDAGSVGVDAALGEPAVTFADYQEARYCEVLVVRPATGGNLLADVFNSLGFGSCPQDLWDALDAKAIQADFPDAVAVVLNGPRFFLMQEIYFAPPASPMIHDFGGIKMDRVASVEVAPSAATAYTETHVNRNTTFRFTRGTRVFELHAPENHTYVMQSFARIVDPSLSYEELPTIASRIAPPDGWSYETRVLDADLYVKATGVATVVQDELKNTYQLEQ